QKARCMRHPELIPLFIDAALAYAMGIYQQQPSASHARYFLSLELGRGGAREENFLPVSDGGFAGSRLGLLSIVT
ncbi:MAG: hypothetical protein L0312_02915, partial [Acidobacteria bacterium]|nr:hypothetical protein [Acidobacteriota bacterium]